MKTQTLYLSDPYLKTFEQAKIVDIITIENQKALVLDKTIFYPMGGGQATDQGFLYSTNNHKAEVYQVQVKDGEILHFIKSTDTFLLNEFVRLEINWDRRYKNMKLHSAGHIIDFAIFLMGYSPNTLKPLKAEHNKDPHIMYEGYLDEDIKDKLQEKVNILISQAVDFKWEFVEFDTLKSKAIYLQPNLPTNKPLRMLELVGVGSVADGGTIVKNTSEVNSIQITAIERIEDNTIVKYKCL